MKLPFFFCKLLLCFLLFAIPLKAEFKKQEKYPTTKIKKYKDPAKLAEALMGNIWKIKEEDVDWDSLLEEVRRSPDFVSTIKKDKQELTKRFEKMSEKEFARETERTVMIQKMVDGEYVDTNSVRIEKRFKNKKEGLVILKKIYNEEINEGIYSFYSKKLFPLIKNIPEDKMVPTKIKEKILQEVNEVFMKHFFKSNTSDPEYFKDAIYSYGDEDEKNRLQKELLESFYEYDEWDNIDENTGIKRSLPEKFKKLSSLQNLKLNRMHQRSFVSSTNKRQDYLVYRYKRLEGTPEYFKALEHDAKLLFAYNVSQDYYYNEKSPAEKWQDAFNKLSATDKVKMALSVQLHWKWKYEAYSKFGKNATPFDMGIGYFNWHWPTASTTHSTKKDRFYLTPNDIKSRLNISDIEWKKYSLHQLLFPEYPINAWKITGKPADVWKYVKDNAEKVSLLQSKRVKGNVYEDFIEYLGKYLKSNDPPSIKKCVTAFKTGKPLVGYIYFELLDKEKQISVTMQLGEGWYKELNPHWFYKTIIKNTDNRKLILTWLKKIYKLEDAKCEAYGSFANKNEWSSTLHTMFNIVDSVIQQDTNRKDGVFLREFFKKAELEHPGKLYLNRGKLEMRSTWQKFADDLLKTDKRLKKYPELAYLFRKKPRKEKTKTTKTSKNSEQKTESKRQAPRPQKRNYTWLYTGSACLILGLGTGVFIGRRRGA